MLKEFKEFALKGNVVDMAIGIIIGAAFGVVVKSLVDDVIMPIVSGLIGTPDFSNLFVVLRNPTGEAFTSIEAAREAGAAVVGIGLFINALIAFLIVAAVLFLVVKAMNELKRQQEAEVLETAPAAAPEVPAQEVLLAEIRDLLREANNRGVEKT